MICLSQTKKICSSNPFMQVKLAHLPTNLFFRITFLLITNYMLFESFHARPTSKKSSSVSNIIILCEFVVLYRPTIYVKWEVSRILDFYFCQKFLGPFESFHARPTSKNTPNLSNIITFGEFVVLYRPTICAKWEVSCVFCF